MARHVSCVTSGPTLSYVDHGRPLNVNNCEWKCDAGYILQGESCIPCPAGTFVNGGSDLEECLPCPYSTTNSDEASDFCTQCSAGFYLITYGVDGHAVCKRCPTAHTTTPGGAQEDFSSEACRCVDAIMRERECADSGLISGAGTDGSLCRCAPGYHGFSWQCQACPMGKYKDTISASSDAQLIFNMASHPDDACKLCPGGLCCTCELAKFYHAQLDSRVHCSHLQRHLLSSVCPWMH